MTDAPPTVLSLTPEAVLAPWAERVDSCRFGYAARGVTVAAEALAGADYLIGDWTHELRLDAVALDRAQRCQAVFQPTAGTETIDLEHAARLGIPVCNAPGTNDRAVAEWTVMAILVLLREAWRFHAGVQAGRWEMVSAADLHPIMMCRLE